MVIALSLSEDSLLFTTYLRYARTPLNGAVEQVSEVSIANGNDGENCLSLVLEAEMKIPFPLGHVLLLLNFSSKCEK